MRNPCPKWCHPDRHSLCWLRATLLLAALHHGLAYRFLCVRMMPLLLTRTLSSAVQALKDDPKYSKADRYFLSREQLYQKTLGQQIGLTRKVHACPVWCGTGRTAE